MLRPPPPHLIYATEDPKPLPLPKCIPPRDALLREVRRILPWKEMKWKKVIALRKNPPRVFYMSQPHLISLPPPRIPLLLPPPVGRIIYSSIPRKAILSLPPPRIPLLLPPPPERGFILVGRSPVEVRRWRKRKREVILLTFPSPGRPGLGQEPPPEHEIYKGMIIKPPGKILTFLIILLTLPGWILLYLLGGFTINEAIGGFKRI